MLTLLAVFALLLPLCFGCGNEPVHEAKPAPPAKPAAEKKVAARPRPESLPPPSLEPLVLSWTAHRPTAKKPAVAPGPAATSETPLPAPGLAAPEKVKATLPPPVSVKNGAASKSSSDNIDPAKQKEWRRALAAARKAMVGRDMETAQKQVAAAEANSQTAKEQAETAECENVLNYLTEFWRLMHLRFSKVIPMEDFEVGNTRAIVSEIDDTGLTIRSEARNYHYNLPEEIPSVLLRALARSGLAGDPATSVVYAVFLAIDPKGSRESADRFFMIAASKGIEIKDLLRETQRIRESAANP